MKREKKVRVLMVDDEATFRGTAQRVLERRGFHTILAASASDAMVRLAENPDVVVLDIKMPGTDGHQVLRELKKRDPSLPVIILTGHGTMASVRQASAEGAFEYLAKPCDIDLLAMKILDAYQERPRADDVSQEHAKVSPRIGSSRK
jgi:DNA-binding NtrC family response regulator